MAYAYPITAAGSYQIKVGAGKLRGLVGSGGSSVTFTAYNTDKGSTTGTTMVGSTSVTTTTMSVSSFAPGGDSGSGIWFDKGLYVTIGGTNPRVTVLYE